MKKYLNISYPFLLVHLFAVVGVILVPFSWKWVGVAIGTYLFKTFFITAGYHRYFTHKSFKMNRFWQFVFAFMGGTNAQKSAIWWAAGHRYHHKHSDTPNDIHSPRYQKWTCHGIWVLLKRHMDLKKEFIPDLLKFPELIWLHKYEVVPPLLWTAFVYSLWGIPGVVYGAAVSSLMNWHGTFVVNSLSHMWGTQDYESNDESRNNFFLALITMGEGWHNNHHAYSQSANHGFHWWQIDLTYYGLLALEKIGIVSDLHKAPVETLVKKNTQKISNI